MSPRGKRSLVAVALLVAAILVFFLTRRPPAPPPAEPVAQSVPERTTAPDDPAVRGGEIAFLEGAGAPSLAGVKKQYEAYKAGSVYPDWSQPLTPDMDFMLRWNDAVTGDLPFDTDGKVFVRFDATRGRVFVGEPYVSWIEAYELQADGTRKPVPMSIERAAVVITGGPAQGDAFTVSYADDGRNGDVQAGDFKYTASFVPSARPELAKAQQARVEAYVQIKGEPRRFVRDFVWAPREVLRVVGVRDKQEGGSLVVTLEVEVLEKGVYTFYGNLMAGDGETPIAFSKRSYPLEAGRHTADLVFFGKVLFDQQIDGPYVVKEIHGLKRQEADELNVWWSYPPAHRTRAYKADDFSGEEWNDPERRERLANFETLIGELEDAGAK